MDDTEKLVWGADIAVGVLGRGGNFVLVPLTGDGPLDKALTAEAVANRYSYCGALTITDGVAAARCEGANPDCIFTMMHAALAFAHQVADKLKPQNSDDGAAWLQRLFELPDPRGDN